MFVVLSARVQEALPNFTDCTVPLLREMPVLRISRAGLSGP